MSKYSLTLTEVVNVKTFDMNGFEKALETCQYANKIKDFHCYEEYDARFNNYVCVLEITVETDLDEPQNDKDYDEFFKSSEYNEVFGDLFTYFNNLVGQYDALFVSEEELASML